MLGYLPALSVGSAGMIERALWRDSYPACYRGTVPGYADTPRSGMGAGRLGGINPVVYQSSLRPAE